MTRTLRSNVLARWTEGSSRVLIIGVDTTASVKLTLPEGDTEDAPRYRVGSEVVVTLDDDGEVLDLEPG